MELAGWKPSSNWRPLMTAPSNSSRPLTVLYCRWKTPKLRYVAESTRGGWIQDRHPVSYWPTLAVEHSPSRLPQSPPKPRTSTPAVASRPRSSPLPPPALPGPLDVPSKSSSRRRWCCSTWLDLPVTQSSGSCALSRRSWCWPRVSSRLVRMWARGGSQTPAHQMTTAARWLPRVTSKINILWRHHCLSTRPVFMNEFEKI